MKKIARKQFLQRAAATGAILGLPVILENCSSLPKGRFKQSDLSDPLLASQKAGLRDPLLQILATGTTAPNPHNVQPWKIQILNNSQCYLFVDETRLLPLTDPPARQIHIGQGTFLEHLSLGASKAGYNCDIEVLPKGPYNPLKPDKPVANISIRKDKAIKPDPLYDGMASRATNRKAYEDYIPTAKEIKLVNQMIGPGHLNFSFETNPTKLNDLNQMFYQAMEIECKTERTYEESRVWFRYNDQEIFNKRDGISLRGSGMSGFKLWMVTQFLAKGKKDWHDPSNIDIYLDGFRTAMQSTKAVAFLSTSGNQINDWVACGRQYARLHLSLTLQGLVMHPLSQILQEYPEMNLLRQQLHQMRGINPPGRIQMAVRIGKASPAFTSPRRDLRDLIRK